MVTTRVSLTILLCLLASSCQLVSTGPGDETRTAASASKPGAPKKKIVDRQLHFVTPGLKATTSIHYTGMYCNECHEPIPGGPGQDPHLKFGGDYRQLCRCHTYASGVYIHPVDIRPSPEKKKRMPPSFPLQDGKLTCRTCHDIYLQCQKRRFERNSLRGAPYARRVDFCHNCHILKKYEQPDPHQQLNSSGEVIVETCLFCHLEKPDEKHATFKDVILIGDIELLCRRCHHIAGNHSGNADHMGIRPSADGLKRIKAIEKKYNVRLPLDENGKMTCITCHNPHAKGVIPENRPGAKGAGSKYRHRLPEILCLECHPM